MNESKVYQITEGDDDALTYARIARATEDVFGLAQSHNLLRPEDAGGVLMMGTDFMLKDGGTPMVAIIGRPKRFSVEESYTAAQEMWVRLYYRPPGQFSAWQSRDLDAAPEQLGGAIATEDESGEFGGYILSFDGPSEHGSEALVTVVASICGILKPQQYSRIVEISQNPLTHRLHNAVMHGLQHAG